MKNSFKQGELEKNEQMGPLSKVLQANAYNPGGKLSSGTSGGRPQSPGTKSNSSKGGIKPKPRIRSASPG